MLAIAPFAAGGRLVIVDETASGAKACQPKLAERSDPPAALSSRSTPRERPRGMDRR
jgi:hypothetical protein